MTNMTKRQRSLTAVANFSTTEAAEHLLTSLNIKETKIPQHQSSSGLNPIMSNSSSSSSINPNQQIAAASALAVHLSPPQMLPPPPPSLLSNTASDPPINNMTRPKSKIFVNSITDGEKFVQMSNSGGDGESIDFQPGVVKPSMLIGNKFGTMPSSAKLASMAKKQSAKSTTAESPPLAKTEEKTEDLNEFQRVFNHLKKVQPTSDSNETSVLTEKTTCSSESNLLSEKVDEASKKEQAPATKTTKPLTLPKSNALKKQQKQVEKEKPIDETDKSDIKKESKKSKQSTSHFNRFVSTRSSVTNLSSSASLTPLNGVTSSSTTSSTVNPLRASFNISHQTGKPKTDTSVKSNETTSAASGASSSIEYASFNIKPSQYKQTGIFLPVNNLNGPVDVMYKKELSVLKLIKDDLELLVQKVRNIQKEKSQNGGTKSVMDQFVKSVSEFHERTLTQMTLLSAPSDSHEISIEQFKMRMKQLLASIKSSQILSKKTCDGGKEIALYEEVNAGSKSTEDASNSNSQGFTQMSKSFNELMQVLDKMSCVYTQQALLGGKTAN